MRHALFRPVLARPDNTIISYYSHKNSYFGKTFLQMEGILNGGNFVTECLIKVQSFFESMCGKKSSGWMAKIYTKTTYGV